MRVGVDSGGRHKIPPLSPHKQKDWVVDSGFSNTADGRNDDTVDSTSVRKTRRRKRTTSKGKGIMAVKRDPHPPAEDREVLSSSIKGEAGDDCTIPQKPVLARQAGCHDMSPASVFPQSGSKIPNGFFTSPAEPFLPPVDPSTPQLARTQTSPVPQQQDELEFRSLDENDEPWKDDTPACAMVNPVVSAMNALEAQERAMKFQLLKEHKQLESVTVSPVSVASAPGAIESPVTKTEVIELDTNSRSSFQSLHNLQQSLVTHTEREEDMSNTPQAPQATYSTGSIIDLRLNVDDSLQNSMTVAPIKQTRHMKRPIGAKIAASTQKGMHVREHSRMKQNGELYPDSLRPVDKPKEALQQSFIQLDSSEWEVTMQGLQLLVRLMRHHPETVHTQLHSVVVAVAKQVRNLRSQVARAACQASGELFLSQKKALETDLDELASPLLHRTSDTNRFLRADSNAALDKMLDVITPSKALAVIVGKGVSHQNAIVLTASARLLVSLVGRVGVDKVMTHTRDMRDKILIAGSNLLTEGSLDTRCFAKQLFRMLSTHPTFNSVMPEVVPSHILRNISKTLQNLK